MRHKHFVMLNSFQHLIFSGFRSRNKTGYRTVPVKFGMTRSAKTIKGFTLIELLIYMGLLSIFLVVLSQIFGSVLDAQLESQSTSAVHRDGRFILSKLTYDIHKVQEDQDIVEPGALGNQSTTLHLKINTVDYIYSLSSGNLQLTEGVVTNNLNSPDVTVSNLRFTRLGNSVVNVANPKNTIKIEYTITSKVIRPKGQETKDFQTTIGIR